MKYCNNMAKYLLHPVSDFNEFFKIRPFMEQFQRPNNFVIQRVFKYISFIS